MGGTIFFARSWLTSISGAPFELSQSWTPSCCRRKKSWEVKVIILNVHHPTGRAATYSLYTFHAFVPNCDMSSRFSMRTAWCSSWAIELFTHSCHAEMSFFCPEEGAGNSYLRKGKKKDNKMTSNKTKMIYTTVFDLVFCVIHITKVAFEVLDT